MSRITYVSQYFVSADQPGGVRHWQHTRALASRGHEVTVITSYVQHKERTIAPQYQGRKIVTEHEDGLRIMRTYSTPGYGVDVRSRVANYGSFAFWAGVAATRAPRPDVIVASSPSLPAAAAAGAVAAARRARFVLEVRDLWPDSLVEMGLVTDSRVISAARRMERWCYRRADRIIALTEGIRDGIIDAGVPAGKVTLITNGVDLDIGADPEPVTLAPDDFVAMYVGAHGTYSSLDTLLDAAAQSAPGIRFVLVGGGDQKDRLVARATEMKLDNVTFVDSVPKKEVPSWLARADVCLLPYQDVPLFAGALPNKTFDYLGAGRPVIVGAPPGELTRLVDASGCGTNIPPEDATALARAVAEMKAGPADSERMGAAGREWVRTHYDRAELAQRFVGVVEGLV